MPNNNNNNNPLNDYPVLTPAYTDEIQGRYQEAVGRYTRVPVRNRAEEYQRRGMTAPSPFTPPLRNPTIDWGRAAQEVVEAVEIRDGSYFSIRPGRVQQSRQASSRVEASSSATVEAVPEVNIEEIKQKAFENGYKKALQELSR